MAVAGVERGRLAAAADHVWRLLCGCYNGLPPGTDAESQRTDGWTRAGSRLPVPADAGCKACTERAWGLRLLAAFASEHQHSIPAVGEFLLFAAISASQILSASSATDQRSWGAPPSRLAIGDMEGTLLELQFDATPTRIYTVHDEYGALPWVVPMGPMPFRSRSETLAAQVCMLEWRLPAHCLQPPARRDAPRTPTSCAASSGRPTAPAC